MLSGMVKQLYSAAEEMAMEAADTRDETDITSERSKLFRTCNSQAIWSTWHSTNIKHSGYSEKLFYDLLFWCTSTREENCSTCFKIADSAVKSRISELFSLSISMFIFYKFYIFPAFPIFWLNYRFSILLQSFVWGKSLLDMDLFNKLFNKIVVFY